MQRPNTGRQKLSLIAANVAFLACAPLPVSAQQHDTTFASTFQKAETALKTGQLAEATILGTTAFDHAQSDSERLSAARLVSASHFRNRRFLAAQFWLRRATNFAETPEDARQLSTDMGNIRGANPVTVNLSFSIAPSDNVNGGAAEKEFQLGGFNFEFAPSSLALSGIEYSGQIDATYKLAQSSNSTTTAGLSLYGRTYSLSREAKDLAPDVKGSDYALTQVEGTLRHRATLFDGFGPSEASLQLGKTWYGGDALRNHLRLAIAQDFILGPNAALKLGGFAERQDALSTAQVDTDIYDLTGVYAQRLANNDVMRFTLQHRVHDADEETFSFSDSRFVISYDQQDRLWNAKLSYYLGFAYKDYDVYSLSLDGRRDRSLSIGTTAVFESMSYYGFSPNLTLAAVNTKSNVARFTSRSLEARLGFTSNF